MSECKKCDKCSEMSENQTQREALLNEALKAKMQMISERIAAREDFNLLTQVVREQYIELRVAPFRQEYERITKLFEEKFPEKDESEVHNLPVNDYN